MILCAGEALIDMLPRQSATGEAAYAPYVGGSVFNTAVALARLGAPTGFLTGLSTDLFGARLAAVLAANGVDGRYLITSDRPTTLAFVTLTHGQAEYAFYDENTAGRMLSEADLPQSLPDVTAVFFGGISLAVEPCAQTYAALCIREAPRCAIMLDPNVRPGFVQDEGRYRARLAQMIAVADIVKLSDEDLHWLDGPGDPAELARGLLARGPRIVCITQGAAGVTGYMAAQEIFVPAEPVEVVDTVGAGDTFNAGFLASLDAAGLLSKSGLGRVDATALRAALGLGARAAAITVSRAGANPPRRDEL